MRHDHDSPAPLPAENGRARRAPRIALYSHDTQGLGHIRRNLLISRALTRGGARPIILLLSGLREASAFEMPSGVDCLTLPSLGKDVTGAYFPRSLDVSMDELIRFRARSISTALASFRPDVLIVDKVPCGIFGELMPSLALLQRRGTTRMVLGLREILDDREAVRREWDEGGYDTVIRTYYDRIWVYGDRSVFDTPREYGFPADLAAMARFSGYLNPCDVTDGANGPVVEIDASMNGTACRHRTLCLVGGGRDGIPLAEAFARAKGPGPRELVTGPLMPEDERRRLQSLAAATDDLVVHEFVTDPCPIIRRADQVIAMGGYNTVCEVLGHGKPLLVVPRTEPRTEQLIRATRFGAIGLLDVLHPDELAPEALAGWMARGPTPRTWRAFDFGGVARLPALLEEVLAERRVEEPKHAAS
jgi:predicted glycosyltransferase